MAKRKIDGKLYNLEAEHRLKPKAKEWAEKKRQQGKLVRIIKSGNGTWLIYTRLK